MDPWQSGDVVNEMNAISGLSTLRMEWTGDSQGLSPEDYLKVLNKLPRLASSLHTLSLECGLQDATLILSFDFPSLKWLRLECFGSKNKTETIMGFFRRHPQLHSLSLVCCTGTWFSNDIEAGFLPNLKHLKLIRLLVPLLPQLVSLAFVDSYNAQVPYLLRAVLPNGLPQLKSLEIQQDIADPQDRKLEGAFGAPNLEELGLHGIYLNSEPWYQSLHPALSQLVKMQRFYYKATSDFLSSAEALARVCTRLAVVTNINGKYLPYIYAKINGILQGKGVGMLISADEEDPFPCNP
ncbi:hypothetical protein BJ912DRAFT_985481 [Pholiota molesta]|nr:hypothetical protein BJ912DRAFT_985481 [Pholiota molesta]